MKKKIIKLTESDLMRLVKRVIKEDSNVKRYKKLLILFQAAVKDMKLSWVDGTILHFWHGSIENRKYRERWLILTENSFDPIADIKYDKNGQIHLTGRGLRFEQYLFKYFLEREEDS